MNGEVKFLSNSASHDHQRLVTGLLKRAKRFDCAVAFARWSGFAPIENVLLAHLDKGMKARFITGLDFCQTEPRLLERLLDLKTAFGIEVYVSEEIESCTFHPKVYRFDLGDEISLLVGSANLTMGGLTKNHEVSALLSLKTESRSLSYMQQLIDDQEVVELTEPILEAYRLRHSVYHAFHNIAQKGISRTMARPTPGLDALREWLRVMKEDKTEQGFASQTFDRARSRNRAKTVLGQISRAPRLSSNAFLRFYEQLADGLWHSGGLHRSKTKIASTPRIFQQIVQVGALRHTGTISKVFEEMRELADNASGVGPNVLTEILQTFDNGRYAVMNQNSVAGMRLAGISQFPRKPSQAAVTGRVYSEFCRYANELRKKLGLKNLSELDALFNYAYWQP